MITLTEAAAGKVKELVDEEILNAPKPADYREYTAKQRLQVETMDRDSRPIKDWIDFAREADGAWPSFPLPLGDAGATGAGRAITIELLNGQQTEAFDAACRAAGARFSVPPPIEPMLAAPLGHQLPADHTGLSFEPKWDGFRVLVYRRGDDVVIQGRRRGDP